MIFPTVEAIQTMSLEDLHICVFLTFEKNPFQLYYVQLGKEILAKEEITIDDIKHLFDFKVEDCSYYFPYIDERSLFQHTFLEHRITPTKGFFWLIEPVVRERMFGLVDVDYSISKVSVKASDERFENFQKIYRETKSFYYDFENKKYVQINKKAKDNEETDEYKHRELLYSAVLERLELENLAYLKRLEGYVSHFFGKDPLNVLSFKVFFEKYGHFLNEEELFLEFKFLLGHMDGGNYYQIKKYFKKLKKEVDFWLVQLERAEKHGLMANFNEYQMRDYSQWYEDMNRTRDSIRKIFKERDFKTIRENKKTAMDGFYLYDQERLYPNLVSIEVDRAFKNVGGGVEYRKKEEKELLESLLKNKKVAAEEESRDLLTEEQKSHLKGLVGSERMTYLNDVFNALVMQKIITSSEKVMFLTQYR